MAALSLLVRSWNVFHGRTVPPSGRTHLERMIRLITADAPHVVALQEVPVPALARLERWSGMAAVAAVARPARLGRLGRRLTEAAPDLFRSLFNGQANALLLHPDIRPAGEQTTVALNPHALRERRVCHCLRVHVDERALLVANFHATAHAPALARAEIERVAGMVSGGEPAIVCGDFNVPRTGLPGFSAPIDGVDQILVRGLELERPPTRWPKERRRFADRFLSDHAPVEAVVA